MEAAASLLVAKLGAAMSEIDVDRQARRAVTFGSFLRITASSTREFR